MRSTWSGSAGRRGETPAQGNRLRSCSGSECSRTVCLPPGSSATGSRRCKFGSSPRRPPCNSCPSSGNGRCIGPIGRYTAANKPISGSPTEHTADIRADGSEEARPRRSEEASRTHRRTAVPAAFSRNERVRAGRLPRAPGATCASILAAIRGRCSDRSRRRSIAHSARCFFGLV